MKPDAPAEIRGPFKPIPTNVPGIQISEIFPRMAKHADKFALVRSVHYAGVAVHDAGHQVMQTGPAVPGRHREAARRLDARLSEGPKGDIPPHVLLPRPIGNTGGNMPHGQTAGFLGKPHDPFVLNADPSDPAFKVPDLLPPDYLTAIRADQRRNLRDLVDGAVKDFEANPDARLLNASFDQAYTLISSAKAREAFDLSKEPDSVKDRYGRNRFGMSCLLARRLVEAGVRFVTVNMFETVFNEITWDIHGSAPFSPIEAYRDLLGPMFDNAYASLLEDLTSAACSTTRWSSRWASSAGRRRSTGRRPRSLAAVLDGVAGRRRHQGRTGGRRVRRDRRVPEGPPGARRGRRGDDATRPGHRARNGAARAAGPAHSRGRPRGRAESRSCSRRRALRCTITTTR